MRLEPVPCEVCGSSRSTEILTKFDLPLARCLECGFVFANPRLPKEVIEERYSSEYFWNEYLPSVGIVDGRYDPEFSAARHRGLLDLIVEEEPLPGRLFEVGTGAGSFLDAARQRGYEVAGIELSVEAVRFARDRLQLDVREAAAEELRLDRPQDVVVAFETLEHLHRPRETLLRVRSGLKPGGLLCLSVPNLSALSRLFLGAEWAVLSPAEHLSYFTEPTLRRLLESVGFEDVRFVRRHPGHGVRETMNAAYTHRPGSWRQAAYRGFIRLLGHRLLSRVQGAGRGDTLLCLARSSRGSGSRSESSGEPASG